MSRRQRRLTPLPMCEYLLARVRAAYAVKTVAVLWTCPRSHYLVLPDVDCWDQARDARLYDGPHPIVAHPPCGPWGKLWHLSRESRDHGIRAMELVHRWGGVVEQPADSRLYREYGEPFYSSIEYVEQGQYGHIGTKRTRLYWWRKWGE